MICPRCQCRLARAKLKVKPGVLWVCRSCQGRAIGLGLLRRLVDPKAVKRIWSVASQSGKDSCRSCPSCQRPMIVMLLPLQKDQDSPEILELDICRSCQFVWFDPKEFGQLPPPPTPPKEPELPARAKEILAMEKIKRIAEKAENEGGIDLDSEESWKYLPALLGMPVERQASQTEQLPWLTWCIAVGCIFFTMIALPDLEQMIDRFGLVPAHPLRYGGLTLLTSFFLHAGWLHLLGNVYFLLVFGDNVEDYLGKGRFVLLLLGATLGGALLHIALDPHSHIPCVGASGGISGVIAFYALAFPHAKLGLLIRFWLYFRWLWLPAWGAFVLWLLLQLLAHLGGAAVGMAFWLLARKK